MTLKKTIRKIHLWLGLSSGIIILFLGLTGCILAFEIETRKLTEPYRNVQVSEKKFLPPSQLKAIAEKHLTSGKALGIEYPGKDKAAIAAYYDADTYELVFIDPYNGSMLKHKNMNKDFFRIVLDGHYYLWLPPTIGQPIVASSTLVFLIMMISGIILWWPKNKAARKQRFSIKWSAKWRRKNYDLHNVLGFYMTWVSIFIALTGLVWGFQWFSRSVYWITSGGRSLVEHVNPISDSTKSIAYSNMTDQLWEQHSQNFPAGESLSIYFANTPADPIEIIENHRPGTYYNTDSYHYDQFTGKELPTYDSYAGKFKEAKTADKIVRMNYDIHVGAILGLPGKILAFCGSLVAASLPLTGFIIWWGRKKKNRKERQIISLQKNVEIV